jgi:hypothetical protein
MSTMEDLTKGDISMPAFDGTPEWNYLWATYSKAYAQVVTGKAYVVIPEGRPINIPYTEKGSMWWSFEAPELSRNPDVTEINYISVDPESSTWNMDTGEQEYEMGPTKTIWRQGDAPLGFPGDPLFKEASPAEPWSS